MQEFIYMWATFLHPDSQLLKNNKMKMRKGFFIGILVFLAFLIFRLATLSQIKGGKTIYQIDVNIYNHSDTYFSTEVSYPEKDIIVFKDEFGITHRMSTIGVDVKQY